MNAYSSEISDVNARFNRQSKESLKQVESSIKSKFSYLITENNPGMVYLRNRLSECSETIKQLQTQKMQIEINIDKITDLFEFKYSEKTEYVEV